MRYSQTTRLDAFHNGCDPLAAADADGAQCKLPVCTLEFPQSREHQAGAGCGHRMPEGDRTAVSVDLVAVQIELSFDSEILNREGIIDFNTVDV